MRRLTPQVLISKDPYGNTETRAVMEEDMYGDYISYEDFKRKEGYYNATIHSLQVELRDYRLQLYTTALGLGFLIVLSVGITLLR